MLPTFGEIMTLLAQVNEKTNEQMEWRITSDGMLKIDAYVGIENADLYQQARVMFAPAENE